jgi:heptosyltransferase-2
LRSEQYDRAIVLPRSFKSAIVPFAAHARVRTGYRGEMRYGLLNDIRKLDKQALPRTVDRFVNLGLDPGERLPVPIPYPHLETDKANGLKVLDKLGHHRPTAPVLGLCPGAEYGPAKRWPPKHFAEVARAKLDEGWEVWIFGSQKDAPYANEIQALSGSRCLNLAGRTELVDVVDLMALTTAVVTNDSGLMHVAAAVGVNVVAIFGSSNPKHTPPLSSRAQIVALGLPCSPCMKRECPYGHTNCLQGLEPNMIIGRISAHG